MAVVGFLFLFRDSETTFCDVVMSSGSVFKKNILTLGCCDPRGHLSPHRVYE